MAVKRYLLGRSTAKITEPAAAVFERIGIDALGPTAGFWYTNPISKLRNTREIANNQDIGSGFLSTSQEAEDVTGAIPGINPGKSILTGVELMERRLGAIDRIQIPQ